MANKEEVIAGSLISSEPYLTVPEAAEHLRVKECSIYGLKYKGKITGYKRGKMLLFKKSELDLLVENGKFSTKEQQ